MIGNQLDRYLALPGLEREPPSLEVTGGTCYRLNTAMPDLLCSPGCVADVEAADMDQPDVHVAVQGLGEFA